MKRETTHRVQETGFLKGILPKALKGFLPAPIVTAVIFGIAALLLTYTALPESAVPFIATVTAILSAAVTGAAMGKMRKHRGYLSGAAAGLSYTLLVYIVSAIVAGHAIGNVYMLVLAAIGLFGGAFGGIIGVNIGNGR